MAKLNQFLMTGMLVLMLILFSLGAPASPAHGATLDKIRAEETTSAKEAGGAESFAIEDRSFANSELHHLACCAIHIA